MKSIGKKKLILIIVTAIILVTLIVIIVNKFNNDGMENSGILNVYYRTYTKEKGWSKWSKNGITSGNKKDNILNIEVKTKRGEQVVYTVLNEENYSYDETDGMYNVDLSKGNYNVKGIIVDLTDSINKKYDVCYRTYNEENKWLNWSCDGQVSGNNDKVVKSIEVKIIPKNVIKYEYLKDFSRNINSTNYGF